MFEKKNIEFLWNSTVEKVIGDSEEKALGSLLILNHENKKEMKIEVDGFFVAIGHSPSTSIFKRKLKMDEEGYIFTEADSTKTSIEGVFAAGDVTDRIFRQAVTAAGMGCMSALEAESFLISKKLFKLDTF